LLGDRLKESERQRLSAFLKYCAQNKWIESNPAETIDLGELEKTEKYVV